MGTIECSQPASKSSWDSQDFGDISMVLKMAYFRKSLWALHLRRELTCHTDSSFFEPSFCGRSSHDRVLSVPATNAM